MTGEAEYTKAPGRDLTYLEEARNTLGQRTFGPTASAETRLDVSGMLDGDVAGLAVYGRSFAYAGVQQVDGERTLGLVTRLQPFTDTIDRDAVESFVPGSQVPLGERTDVHLKADADFASPGGQLWVQYSFSLDGRTWQPLGPRQGPLVMDWSLSHFMGYRFGLFSYAKEQTGGHVDFDHFLLSDVLDADGGADRTALDAVVAEAGGLDPAGYTAESWAAVEQASPGRGRRPRRRRRTRPTRPRGRSRSPSRRWSRRRPRTSRSRRRRACARSPARTTSPCAS